MVSRLEEIIFELTNYLLQDSNILTVLNYLLVTRNQKFSGKANQLLFKERIEERILLVLFLQYE